MKTDNEQQQNRQNIFLYMRRYQTATTTKKNFQKESEAAAVYNPKIRLIHFSVYKIYFINLRCRENRFLRRKKKFSSKNRLEFIFGWSLGSRSAE